jgi:hypothetical protein
MIECHVSRGKLMILHVRLSRPRRIGGGARAGALLQTAAAATLKTAAAIAATPASATTIAAATHAATTIPASTHAAAVSAAPLRE